MRMNAGIVGAGIMGQLLALALHRIGWQVTLFDQDSGNSCSIAAAGLLTPIAELEKSEPVIFKLGMDALNHHWPNILQQLPDKIDFQQSGTIVVAHPQDQAELKQFIRQIENRLPDKGKLKEVNQTEIKNLEPALEKFHQGYYFSEEGYIDNQKLLAVLKSYLKEKMSWHDGQHVTQIKPHHIFVADQDYIFDRVFDCRGLGAKSVFDDLRGVRGELVWLHAPAMQLSRPVRVLHPRYQIYIVPRENHTYLVGATEIESEDRGAISVRSMLELLTAVFYVHPGFSEARVIKTVTHCRPTLPHHLPSIKYTEGLVAINGLYRHGFLIAPTLAEEIVSWLQAGMSFVRYPQLWSEHFLGI